MAASERLPLVKKRKKRSEDNTDTTRKAKKPHLSSEDHPGNDIERLEAEILESQKNYNKINELLRYADPSQDFKTRRKAYLALCTVFSQLLALGRFSIEDIPHSQDNVIDRWLAKRYKQYCHLLLQALPQDSQFISKILMETVRQETSIFSSNKIWTGLYHQLIDTGLKDDNQFFGMFAKDSILPFKDATTYACRTIATFSDMSGTAIDQAISFLLSLEFSTAENQSEDVYLADLPPKSERKHPSSTTYKKAVQDAYLAVMRNQLSIHQRKRILDRITTSIVPWFSKPELLIDFLVDSFHDEETALKALSGMFELMQQKNLDIPSFYTHVYSLLDDKILHSKERSRFLKLLDIFLASTHLPAALVASFLKRLSRLCLYAPPAAVIAIIPWIYNTIQTHTVCSLMIHRSDISASLEQDTTQDHNQRQGFDPFLPDEPNPLLTQALSSSLWEIHSLAQHYHPNTATLASIIGKPFTKRSYKLEDFWDHSYEDLLDAQLARPVKREPFVEYQIPKRIFSREEEEMDGSSQELLALLRHALRTFDF